MKAMSNAFFDQANIEQTNHWDFGPLEFVSFDFEQYRENRKAELFGLVAEWNRSYEGGFVRSSKSLDKVNEITPVLGETKSPKNPNLFLVPKENGFSQLDVMLGSVVPESILRQYMIKKENANLWLLPLHESMDPEYGVYCQKAFEKYIWTRDYSIHPAADITFLHQTLRYACLPQIANTG